MVAVLMASCAPSKSGDIPLIRSGSEYTAKLQEAEQLSAGSIAKYEANIELSETDLANLKKSEAIFKGLIGFRPETFSLYLALGKVYQIQGQHDKAIDQFDLGIQRIWNVENAEVKQIYAEAWHASAVSFLALQKYTDAAECSQFAMKAEPESPIYKTQAARAYVQLKEFKVAHDLLDEAIKLDPNYGPARDLHKLLESVSPETVHPKAQKP